MLWFRKRNPNIHGVTLLGMALWLSVSLQKSLLSSSLSFMVVLPPSQLKLPSNSISDSSCSSEFLPIYLFRTRDKGMCLRIWVGTLKYKESNLNHKYVKNKFKKSLKTNVSVHLLALLWTDTDHRLIVW